MNYRQALDYLSQYANYERELRYPYDGWSMNLERVAALLEGLGKPQEGLRFLHVAGTKGKGTTAAMIEAVARAAGMKTGLFTSPHLTDFRERIRIKGDMVEKDMVARITKRIEPAAKAVHKNPELGPLTYFEILTAMAVAAFSEAGTDLAVLEAGLGGRYDATNFCDPLLCVITPISLDHTDILGDTIQQIAAEKAIIIKPGKIVVTAPQPKEARKVIAHRCQQVAAREERVNELYSWKLLAEDPEGQRFSLAGPRTLENLFVAMPGEPARINAATATAAADALSRHGVQITDLAIRQGLNSLKWPARFQRVREAPDVILDGAHNASSAFHLRNTLESVYPGRRITAAVGMGGDKDVEGFFEELGPVLSRVVITRSKAMKAVDADRIRKALSAFEVETVETGSVKEALDIALKSSSEDDVVLVTGSFYVISEALDFFRRSGQKV